MKFPLSLRAVFSAVAASALTLFTSASATAEEFYVGTYSHWFGSKGIYHFQFDPKTGTISGGELVGKAVNPSFVAIHPNLHQLYVCNENKEGSVSAFTILPDHRLQFIDSQSSKGGWPCHVTFDRTHRYVFVANYLDGTVAVLPIQRGGGIGAATGFDQQKGKGPNADRQEGPHAHSIYADPANRFVYSCDLGNDRVEGYRFHSDNGTITPSKTATTAIAAGSGPRHLALDPRGYVYVINELTCTITVLHRDEATGAMHTVRTVGSRPAAANSLPAADGFETAAEIVLHPNGKFLYASNRGLKSGHPNTISVLAVAGDGRLKLIQNVPTRGRIPRNFALDPSGRWLIVANQDSSDLFVFRVSAKTGELTPVGDRVRIGTPACIAFLPPK